MLLYALGQLINGLVGDIVKFKVKLKKSHFMTTLAQEWS